MRITRYRNERDASPEVVEVEWDTLAALLTDHTRSPCSAGTCPGRDCAHKSGPAWSPVLMRPCPARCHRAGTSSDCGGGRFHRLNANVEALTVGVFDLDHLSLEQFDAVARAVASSGLAAIVHSTHSHKPPADLCLRLVLPFNREATAEEGPRLRAAIIARLGLPADPKTKDVSRLYFLPSTPVDGEPIAEVLTGGRIVVDEWLKFAPAATRYDPLGIVAPPAPLPPAPEALTEGGPVDLERLRERLRHVTKPESKELARTIVDGRPLAEEGARDDTLNRAVSLCACALPAETPNEAIIELLRPSVLGMPGDPPPGQSDWLALALYKLERARERRTANDAVRDQFNAEVRARLCREAAAAIPVEELAPGEDPAAAYTPEQLAKWFAEQDCADAEEFQRRWIIQRGKAFWVFAHGLYRSPISNDDLAVSLPRDLARVPEELIALSRENAEGNTRPAKPAEILRDHATVARDVQASLALQRSYYDPATQTFFEAVRPLRRIQPREHVEIQYWLQLLGGDQVDKLLDWVATVMRLDRQSCALYFNGEPGVGKNLFACGLARLWTTGGPAELLRVLQGFNDAITMCPLAFADEALPQQKGITSELRRLVGSTSRNLNRKFLPTCNLDGALRLVLAGNNDRLLDTGEDLSANDLDAVAGRFLYLRPNPEAREYMLDLGGPPVVGKWITEDLLAEHALWLRDNRKVNEGARFLVEGVSTEFHEHLATGSGMSGLVCEWLVRYLVDPVTARPAAGRAQLVIVGEGEVWANTEALAGDSAWKARVPSANVPSATKIGRALRNLSLDPSGEAPRILLGDKQYTFHRIKPALLLSWAERAQVGDLDELRRRIAAPNEHIAKAKKRRGG